MTKATHKEAHVRDSLSNSLEKLEDGLVFLEKEAYIPSKLGTKGFIDLLAKDKSGRFVIIEVKKTGPATRETIHEILKYIEGVKAHIGLAEHEIRVFIASVEWAELLVPFSSFVSRISCAVEGFELTTDAAGNVLEAMRVEPLTIRSDRLLAPWQELRFYRDAQALSAGIESYERAWKSKGDMSFVLVQLDAPLGATEGFPSTKQIANRRMIAEMAAATGNIVKDIPDELYRHALYFAMQQLTKEECIESLPRDEEIAEFLENLDDSEPYDELGSLHEKLMYIEPTPMGDYLEIGYPAKFRSRLLDEEGWRIAEVRRYGAFSRNKLLLDQTIIDEIGGSQGNALQNVKFTFVPSEKAQLAEARRRVDSCLRDNQPWRSQINEIFDQLVALGEDRSCYISIMNPSSALATVYMAATRPNGMLYIPTYTITVPEENNERMYFGVLSHNGSSPRKFQEILDEFYNGRIFELLFPLQWGGYESRDVAITRRLGLRYKTYLAELDGPERNFFELDDHQWEPCDPIDPFNSYLGFLKKHENFTRDVIDIYGSRWDGSMVSYQQGD